MNKIIFAAHPIYDDYEASTDGIIRHKRNKKNIGIVNKFGYIQITVYVNGKVKSYRSHRFIWECFNGLITDGLVIDHINRNRLNTKLALPSPAKYN